MVYKPHGMVARYSRWCLKTSQPLGSELEQRLASMLLEQLGLAAACLVRSEELLDWEERSFLTAILEGLHRHLPDDQHWHSGRKLQWTANTSTPVLLVPACVVRHQNERWKRTRGSTYRHIDGAYLSIISFVFGEVEYLFGGLVPLCIRVLPRLAKEAESKVRTSQLSMRLCCFWLVHSAPLSTD